jgi:phosphoenolpyruvate carboxykinase (GTP)
MASSPREPQLNPKTRGNPGARRVARIQPYVEFRFLSIPVGAYVQKNLDFGKDLKKAPRIFSVNYFLKRPGNRGFP